MTGRRNAATEGGTVLEVGDVTDSSETRCRIVRGLRTATRAPPARGGKKRPNADAR